MTVTYTVVWEELLTLNISLDLIYLMPTGVQGLDLE